MKEEYKSKAMQLMEQMNELKVTKIAMLDDAGKPLIVLRGRPDHIVNLIANCMANNEQVAHYFKAAVLAYQNGPKPIRDRETQTLLTFMGIEFQTWAEDFFHPRNGKLNVKLPLMALVDFYNSFDNHQVKLNPQKMTKKLAAWCVYMRYEFCPEKHCNEGMNIIEYRPPMHFTNEGDLELKDQMAGKVKTRLIYINGNREEVKTSKIVGLNGSPIIQN
ncbi:hypothetical protein [Jiulongibacter sp. NS-SX5]|uniref:hypothetical protein n=1 Tax=Jiulongibacter sp. NS-SX5 TaxID=3463854 RepID=UPI00405A09DC